MPILHEFQTAFLSDIYAGTRHSAAYLSSCQDCAADRLSIYRNNTLLGLTDILVGTYPVIHKLVGASYFKTMSRHYIEENPQPAGNRHSFGAELASFLDRYEPALSLPYLPDIAKIEWAYFQALLADDAEAINAQQLGQTIAAHADCSLSLHPSAQLITQRHNALEIWQAQQQESSGTVRLEHKLHQLLVWRDPADSILILPISYEMTALLGHCQKGVSLAQALSESCDPAIIQSEFARLLAAGVFVQPENVSS